MNGADYFGVFYPHNILAIFLRTALDERRMNSPRTADAAALPTSSSRHSRPAYVSPGGLHRRRRVDGSQFAGEQGRQPLGILLCGHFPPG